MYLGLSPNMVLYIIIAVLKETLFSKGKKKEGMGFHIAFNNLVWILCNLKHFLMIIIFMGWGWPMFYENTDKAE